MLELYYRYRRMITRYRSGALGNEIDRIAADLSNVGYKHDSAKIYLSRIAHFSAYATRCGCGKSTPIGGTDCRSFPACPMYTCGALDRTDGDWSCGAVFPRAICNTILARELRPGLLTARSILTASAPRSRATA